MSQSRESNAVSFKKSREINYSESSLGKAEKGLVEKEIEMTDLLTRYNKMISGPSNSLSPGIQILDLKQNSFPFEVGGICG